MNSGYLTLTLDQVLTSALLIGLAMGISFLNRTRLERQYLIGAIRAFIQLWLIGYVLLWVFNSQHPLLFLLMVETMITAGTLSSARQQDYKCKQTFWAIWLSLHASAAVVGVFLFYCVIRIAPLSNPHLFIPLMGMIIGNAANGAALSVHRLRGDIESHIGEIEIALSLGASPEKAVEPYVVNTMRSALIPSINGMMMMGIVQLPGILSGQVVSGVEPVDAVRYQIVVLYMIAASVSLACYLTTKMEAQRFFTKRWALSR